MQDLTVGETITEILRPTILPLLEIEEPTVKMQFMSNNGPFAGKEGKFVTSRNLRDRLFKELKSNVALRVQETASPDTFDVLGRGELHLTVLIETMRREGYELQVSRPEVIVREIDGKRHEPLERAVIDVPDEHVGTVTQALAPRKGKVTDLRPGDIGRTIVTIEAPSRGLIGFRSQLLTATRGTALMHQHHAGWVAWVGDLPTRKGGAMISDRTGVTTGYALGNLQERGEMFVGPGEAVYEGMIVGENSRPDDMQINVVREKQKTNIRTHSHDEAIKLNPPRILTLETAIEFIAEDELVEVTPATLRVRKRQLREQERRRTAKS
jgi:GTP-binding protein